MTLNRSGSESTYYKYSIKELEEAFPRNYRKIAEALGMNPLEDAKKPQIISNTPKYWDNFWNDNVLGGGGADPDAVSKTLQNYHQLLWSKLLPNGEHMNLVSGKGSNYLTWKNFRFGSDSILASFRYVKYREMLEEVSKTIPKYKEFIESFIHKTYTIGGSIIFPKENSINRARGVNPFIKDRWDLTLECIRKYYKNEDSPLYETLVMNKEFFDLFVDFNK